MPQLTITWITSLVVLLFLSGCSGPLPGDELTPAGYQRNTSYYIDMPDGARIAAEVWLPQNLAVGERVPAVIEATRYWRGQGLTILGRSLARLGLDLPGVNPGQYDEYFPRHNYAMVTIDVRGTGASSGVHTTEYSRQERLDHLHVIDWVTQQPWSSGDVFAVGVSYSGTNAELMAAAGHPSLRAVAPLFSDFDAQLQLARPGGIYQPAFIEVWSEFVGALDRNDLCDLVNAGEQDPGWLDCLIPQMLISGVKPVEGEEDFLETAVESHNSPNVAKMVRALDYRDSTWGSVEALAEEILPYGLKSEIETANVPMFIVAGWFDAGTANGALARFATFSNPQEVWIGPFSHGGGYDTDPYAHANKDSLWTGEVLLDRVRRFFEQHRTDRKGSPALDRTLNYYVHGSDGFRTTRQWPPAGVQPKKLYFNEHHELATQSTTESGSHEYAVVDDVGTASTSRWLTQMGGDDVVYDAQAEMAATHLHYTTAPMKHAFEITGTVTLDLWVTTDQSENALHAYLQDVAPDGTVRYLTEGMLDFQHRKNTLTPDYPMFGPWHSFLKRDAADTPVGTPVNIQTTLFATTALIKEGHRLRLAISGADQTSFARIPAVGPMPNWQVHYGDVMNSSITLTTSSD